MRRLIFATLMAATVLPGAASAQSQGELRRDRQDIREERRDVRDAQRRGDWREAREQRRDVRDARQEYREDLRDARERRWGRDDWRGWRDRNRDLYGRGQWHAPFRYQTFSAGRRIAPAYYVRRYWIADPWRYHLPPARPYTRWVRHYNDVLLIDYRRGIVVEVIRDFYW